MEQIFRLSKSRWAAPPRRAPNRLAALLTAFRLIYRVLPAPDFHGWSVRQQFVTRVGISTRHDWPHTASQVLCGVDFYVIDRREVRLDI